MRSLTVTAVGVLVLAAAAVPARAQESQAPLRLTILPATGSRTAVTLACEPDGGSHPRPAEACAALRAVDGHLDRLPGQNTVCTMQYDPVSANAIGTWRGRKLVFKKMYGNACELHSALDPVFRFGG
ncbi:MAG: putative in inhibitor protein [Actinomycetia bacterium]|nr:putative in inhibitor protein [Actinomycetes bacterium]